MDLIQTERKLGYEAPRTNATREQRGDGTGSGSNGTSRPTTAAGATRGQGIVTGTSSSLRSRVRSPSDKQLGAHGQRQGQGSSTATGSAEEAGSSGEQGASSSTTPRRSGGRRTHTRSMSHLHDGTWFPAPQPSITLDAAGAMTIVSFVAVGVSFMQLTTVSFGANAILSGFGFCSFLLASLLFIADINRLSSEFMREHMGYNVPLGRRAFVWHRSWIAGMVAFYFGVAAWIATAAWTLAESRRLVAGLATAGLGVLAIAIGLSTHLSLIHRPLGIATDLLYNRGYGLTPAATTPAASGAAGGDGGDGGGLMAGAQASGSSGQEDACSRDLSSMGGGAADGRSGTTGPRVSFAVDGEGKALPPGLTLPFGATAAAGGMTPSVAAGSSGSDAGMAVGWVRKPQGLPHAVVSMPYPVPVPTPMPLTPSGVQVAGDSREEGNTAGFSSMKQGAGTGGPPPPILAAGGARRHLSYRSNGGGGDEHRPVAA